MEKEELKQKWDELYAMMVSSGNPKNMILFGEVMKLMMERSINYDQAFAERMLDKLCAMKWKNYVTAEEAEISAKKMNPQPNWDYNQWLSLMQRLGISLEEAPYYNRYALYLAMCMKASDSRTSIAKMMGKLPTDLTIEELATCTHMLAIDVLKDKDERFNIRKYFDL